jgi:predicted O-methyltransferase YrrM
MSRELQSREFDGVEFIPFDMYSKRYATTSTRFMVGKGLGLNSWIDLLARFSGGNIVELGVFEGGSTALTALVSSPNRFLAVDLTPEPSPALEAFLDEQGLRDRVRVEWGVDQSDIPCLERLLCEHIGEEPLDLVVDDASHVRDLTLASFDLLFPRLRPGGLFVIEDWSFDIRYVAHMQRLLDTTDNPRAMELVVEQKDVKLNLREIMFDLQHIALQEPTAVWATKVNDARRSRGDHLGPAPEGPPARIPLADMILSLVVLHATRPDVVSELHINEEWVEITRGPAELTADFSLNDLVTDPYRLLGRRA